MLSLLGLLGQGLFMVIKWWLIISLISLPLDLAIGKFIEVGQVSDYELDDFNPTRLELERELSDR